MSSHPLVGKFFHTFDKSGSIREQGEITAEVGQGIFLCQYHSWLTGGATNSSIVSLESMIGQGWAFYDHMEDLKLALKQCEKREAGRE